MTDYGLVLLISVIVCFLTYGLRVRQQSLSSFTFVLSLPFILFLGPICAKVLYVLCYPDFSMMDEYWFEEKFLTTDASTFSVFGGAAGVILAIVLACAFTRRRLPDHGTSCFLDAFAPSGALLLCGIRVGELYLGTLGFGPLLASDSPLAVYPLAMQNRYGESFVSIFFLEAFFALVCSLIFFFVFLPDRKGLRFELTVFFLCVPQIFCESLRARCMKWGFVRIEQLLCGVIIFLIVFLNCRCLQKQGCRRFLPALGILVCIGLIVFVEFALDKFNISDLMCYLLMILALLGMSCLELLTIHRRLKTDACH